MIFLSRSSVRQEEPIIFSSETAGDSKTRFLVEAKSFPDRPGGIRGGEKDNFGDKTSKATRASRMLRARFSMRACERVSERSCVHACVCTSVCSADVKADPGLRVRAASLLASCKIPVAVSFFVAFVHRRRTTSARIPRRGTRESSSRTVDPSRGGAGGG